MLLCSGSYLYCCQLSLSTHSWLSYCSQAFIAQEEYNQVVSKLQETQSQLHRRLPLYMRPNTGHQPHIYHVRQDNMTCAHPCVLLNEPTTTHWKSSEHLAQKRSGRYSGQVPLDLVVVAGTLTLSVSCSFIVIVLVILDRSLVRTVVVGLGGLRSSGWSSGDYDFDFAVRVRVCG